MILKKINLQSFGKFQKKTIELHPGLNLIHGENEAGKTTLHKFIEGMFFGFYKPYSKNKIYTPDQDKYQPWNNAEYKGIIEYDQDGKSYRLERNFARNSESVKLYNNTTGDELTALLEYDGSQKTYKANKHMDINSVLFKNTVSIGQLANVTDEGLTKEIGDLLINTGDTFSAQVSFKAALETLNREKAAIGTKKQLKSPYGSCAARLHELEEEKTKAQFTAEENKIKYSEIRELETQLSNASLKKGSIQENRERLRLKKLLERYERYSALQNEISELQAVLDTKSTLSETDYEAYNEASAKYELIAKQAKEIESKKEQISEKLIKLNKEIAQYRQSQKDSSQDEISQDAALLTQRIKKLEELKIKQKDDENPQIQENLKKLRTFERVFSVIGMSFVAAALVAAALGFFVDSKFYTYSIGAGGGAILFLILWGIMGTKSSNLEPYYERYDTIMSRTSNMIVMCELDIAQLKQKYRCKDTDELIELLAQQKSGNTKMQEYENELDFLNKSLSDLKSEIENLNAGMKEYQSVMKNILSGAGLDSADMLKDAVSATRQQDVLRAKMEAAFAAVADVMGDMTPKALESEAQNALQMGIKIQGGLETEDKDEIESANSEILNITSKIAALQASVLKSENSVRSLNAVLEDIVNVNEKIKKFEENLKALDLAIEKIELISKDIHNNFAEDFNEYVSGMIRDITKGKYTEVKVNDKMEIKVIDPQHNRLTDVASLSGGTIDQLYFAVRFAVIDLIIKDKSIPVFLDDCFLQYDDNRLENIVKLIAEIAKRRQVLLFTCRNAENTVFKKNAIPFHYIEL